MSELLFEIGTEELPAGFVRPALSQIESLAESAFNEARIAFESISVMGTPRRLVLAMKGVAAGQEDRVTEQKGPPASAAFDAGDKPTQAALGFARKCGVGAEDLLQRDGYVYASVHEKGRSTVEVAGEILPRIVRSLSFPKSMRWGSGDLRFGRPIRWMVALLDDQQIRVEVDGVAAGRATFGHRFLNPEAVKVRDASAYWDLLRDSHVIVDDEQRRDIVKTQVEEKASEAGGRVPWDEVAGLLDEVTYMVEYPTAFVGNFDGSFLKLPRRVLIEVMRKHQQYFPVARASGASGLMPHFIAVRNGDKRSLEIVRRGNEKVLRARFADAAFFFQQDTKTRLADKVDALSGVVYQSKLGTMLDKANRLSSLAGWIAQRLGAPTEDCQRASRAGLLAKADLTTQMVIELPSLQGAMGAEYALRDGEDNAVAAAIGEQYEPAPKTELGKVVTLADKIDTLCSHFGIGLEPTGSSDPYALRRAATVATAILSNVRLPLSQLLDEALRILAAQKLSGGDAEQTKASVTRYFGERLGAVLAERGIRYDVADAVLAAGFDILPEALARAGVVEKRRKGDPGFLKTTMAATRIVNILRHARDKGVKLPGGSPSIHRYAEPQEHALHEAHLRAAEQIVDLPKGTSPRELERRYDRVFELLSGLQPVIDDYFDRVMVMTDDAALRENRLKLLRQINKSFFEVCDFSAIVQDAPD
jgi:glycyl-tRNA synthetase beta chain